MIRPQPHPRRIRDEQYLAWIRTQPCSLHDDPVYKGCDGQMDAHHVKPEGGGIMGGKVSDRRTVPLCRKHHCIAENLARLFRTYFEQEILRLNREYGLLHREKRPAKKVVNPQITAYRIRCACQETHTLAASKVQDGRFWCARMKKYLEVA